MAYSGGMLARRWGLAGLIAISLSLGCGGGDDSDDGGGPSDAAILDGAAAADAPPAPDSGSGGTQGIGQFCDTLPEGGPDCMDGLSCCNNVCREPADCEGGDGYLPCDEAADCQGKVCCQTPQMTFCTKSSSCDSYGGTELP